MDIALQTCSKVLRPEADALAYAQRHEDLPRAAEAIALICKCTGKVIVLGFGKSGLVGRKIAATLTSSGTMAPFIHAADAFHGDLGHVSHDDVVILISNSGETDELISLLPHLKHHQVRIIAITGHVDSTLARHATVVLLAAVERVACLLNLAPTASASVALMIGDALAMAVARCKRLTKEDFVFNHPAGRLGKRLTLTVADLMHTGANNPTIGFQASWIDVIKTLMQLNLGAINVVDSEGRLCGIATDGDLRRALRKVEPARWAELNCGAMMTARPVTVTADSLAYDALQPMENRPSQISVLPVVDGDNQCVGLVKIRDIVRAGL